jgi:hypothetical protein
MSLIVGGKTKKRQTTIKGVNEFLYIYTKVVIYSFP